MIFTFTETRKGRGYDVVSLDHTRVLLKEIPTRVKAERIVGKLNKSVRIGNKAKIAAPQKNKRKVNIPISELIEAKENRKNSKNCFESSKYVKDMAEKYDVDIATIYSKLRSI